MEDLTPLYNKEFYLAYLCGEDVVLPIPDGNAERYLAYLCGMDVTIPDVPDGRTETYLAYKCGEDVVLPDPMYRIEFYLAKWCGIDCEVPEPMYRIEYWLAQLANSGELKTVTGNPISVSDALAKPAESLTIEILPQQSGSGDPSPDNVRPISGFTGVNVQRTGKNLLDDSIKTVNGSRLLIGATTPYESPTYLKAGTYSITIFGVNATFVYLMKNQYALQTIVNGTNHGSFTVDNDGYYRIDLYGSTATSGDVTGVILVPGSTYATAYEPYQGTTYSISWQDSAGTVYGGTLDVTTGVLTVDRAMVDLGTLNWDYNTTYAFFITYSLIDRKIGVTNMVSDLLKTEAGSWSGTPKTNAIWGNGSNATVYVQYPLTAVEDFLALVTGHQLVYELATPQTIQLTPTEIEMLLGNNVIWNDVGDMVLEYLADGPADDIDALNILLNNRYVNNGEPDEATDREALEILLGGNTR